MAPPHSLRFTRITAGHTFVLICTIALHYLVTPAELSSPFLSWLVRAVAGTALLLLLLVFLRPSPPAIEAIAWSYVLVVMWFALNTHMQRLGTLQFIGVFSLIAFAIAFSSEHSASPNRQPLIAPILTSLLLLWVGSLLLQVGYFIVYDEIVDLHGVMHPGSESRIFDAFAFLRFTGVHLEPGTYANWTYGLVLLRGLVTRRLFDALNVVAVSSILITLSAWGAASATFYLLCAVLYHVALRATLGKALLVILLVCGIAISVWTYFDDVLNEWITYLLVRAELGDESGVAKLQAYEGFQRLWPQLVFLGKPHDYDFCGGCLSPQDAGVFVNMAVRSGLIFSTFLFCTVFFAFLRTTGVLGVAVAAPLIIAKYYYFEPLFWLIVGVSVLQVFRNPSHADRLAISRPRYWRRRSVVRRVGSSPTARP